MILKSPCLTLSCWTVAGILVFAQVLKRRKMQQSYKNIRKKNSLNSGLKHDKYTL